MEMFIEYLFCLNLTNYINNNMNRFAQVFKCCARNQTAIIGMIHVKGLPMSPLNNGLSIEQLIDISCKEAEIYKKHGLDAICVENMFDIPYVTRKDSGPEVTAIMTRICSEVKKCVPNMAVGVQVLAGLNHEALAVAAASNLQFIRCEAFIFGHIADEGYMDGCAGSLLRYRKQLNANNVLILTDIKKKHCSHTITNDVNVVEMAKAAQFFLSDAVIITGLRTGHLADLKDVNDINNSNIGIPIIIGSGVNHTNIEDCIQSKVNAVIIGSHFKEKGVWSQELSDQRIDVFMKKVHQIYHF